MEILAPAGNMDALKAAVACGADAVYLGTKYFNARSKADNFSDEQLRLAVSYCHERGVRVYVTLNILIKTAEIKAAVNAVEAAWNAGADAFLIQDLGLYLLLRKKFPQISFHTSTQMGVHNLPGAQFAQKLGFDRIVLSRETLPSDIRKIKDNTTLQIEMFVHGAHCVSFSGNCYFSAMVSGYSGNRGKCLQLCRKKYTLCADGKKKHGYMLSAKDICMLTSLRELKELGVDSLKIEGRLRSVDYVGTATDVYKRAVAGKGSAGDIDRLKTVFNRGNYSRAYIDSDKADIIYPLQQNHIGLPVAKIVASKGASLVLDRKYRGHVGDGFKILRGGREVGNAVFTPKGFLVKGNASKGDELRLTKSAELCDEIYKKINDAVVDEVGHNNNIEKEKRTNFTCIMSDIVRYSYNLPAECVIAQADEACDPDIDDADIVILSPTCYNIEALKKFRKCCHKPTLLDMPIEARGADIDILQKVLDEDIFDGYVANNIYALEMCRNKKILLGTGMNSISNLLDYPKIMSVEAATDENNAALYAYGKVTLMNLTHCPRRQMGFDCRNCGSCGELSLTDEQGNSFTLRRRRISYCYWELLNVKSQNLLPKLDANVHRRIVIDIRGLPREKYENILKAPYEIKFDENRNTYGRFGKGVK